MVELTALLSNPSARSRHRYTRFTRLTIRARIAPPSPQPHAHGRFQRAPADDRQRRHRDPIADPRHEPGTRRRPPPPTPADASQAQPHRQQRRSASPDPRPSPPNHAGTTTSARSRPAVDLQPRVLEVDVALDAAHDVVGDVAAVARRGRSRRARPPGPCGAGAGRPASPPRSRRRRPRRGATRSGGCGTRSRGACGRAVASRTHSSASSSSRRAIAAWTAAMRARASCSATVSSSS